jgi:fluoride exporter
MNTLMVIIGAAIGSPARFLVDQYFKKFTDKPAGTFIVNILGSFLIGLTFATTEQWHDFLAVGFELKRYKVVAINLFASLIFGLLAAYLGYNLVS